MTNFERLSKMHDLDDIAHFMCDSMDYIGDGFPCEVCPVKDKCLADSLSGNGWFHWLREEAKA